MLKKVLIANRGEIAVRIIRTCREMGIESVAVYSDLDRNALHVRLADEAYALGGKTAAESYLRVDAIMDAVKRSGADGLHPGYGFLSENPDLANACQKAGVIFIGPPVDAITAMGDKVSARSIAAAAKVKGVPGTSTPIKDASEIINFGKKHGWPVAIKAAFGGGGRGMKVVRSPEEAESALSSAQREATAYFGRAEAYLERYLEWPRHIEMQIFADKFGNCVWLGERDCSVQRRHQKLIEESPAPNFPQETRVAMGQAAVELAKACKYEGAGTIEFLYQDGEFYFLEMNTRLQVEHPVTEAVTGFDLVEWQIRIASGEPLPVQQSDIQPRGHAIECRINAEDPTHGAFRPSPGRITKLRNPDGFGTRVDSGFEAGDEVSQYYDNLISKVIVWGKDRDSARRKALRALSEMEITGVATTIPAHQVILSNTEFSNAQHSTTWLETKLDLSKILPHSYDNSGMENDESESIDNINRVEKKVQVEINKRRFEVKLWVPEHTSSIASKAEALLKKAQHKKPGSNSNNSGAANRNVTAPMQGTVLRVLVKEGEKVERGQTICVLEAMKMENNINAEISGTVKDLSVSEGQNVGPGDTICHIS